MFRARNHEGVATECLFEVLVGGRRLTSEQKVKAFAGCAVIAHALVGRSERGEH